MLIEFTYCTDNDNPSMVTTQCYHYDGSNNAEFIAIICEQLSDKGYFIKSVVVKHE